MCGKTGVVDEFASGFCVAKAGCVAGVVLAIWRGLLGNRFGNRWGLRRRHFTGSACMADEFASGFCVATAPFVAGGRACNNCETVVGNRYGGILWIKAFRHRVIIEQCC